MHILHVVGTRPNFIKAAPVLAALAKRELIQQTLVHTGQHYDANMSEVFFRELDMPLPDVNLAIDSGTHYQQISRIMARFEPVVCDYDPDLVLVYGDVTSTRAAAQVCSKIGIHLSHIEAGLRSYDRSMPEEMNRVIADQLSDLLFTPSSEADENLCREGVGTDKIHRVGNVMIDSLVRMLPQCTKPVGFHEGYALVTLHRPSNVDDPAWLSNLLAAFVGLAEELPVIFPVHPRTCQRIVETGFNAASSKINFLESLPYLTFLALQKNATVVITDSGGVQEETTYLGIPCLTLRENTERPITVSLGTNLVIGRDIKRMRQEVANVLCGKVKKRNAIPLWDGHTAERIAKILVGV